MAMKFKLFRQGKEDLKEIGPLEIGPLRRSVGLVGGILSVFERMIWKDRRWSKWDLRDFSEL